MSEPLVIRTLAEVERTYILNVLSLNNWCRTTTYQILGIDRRTLTNKLNLYRDQGYLIPPGRGPGRIPKVKLI
jgi:DNA-binding NtrC family response regulator